MLLAGQEVVVDLHDDLAALAQAYAVAGLDHRLLAAGRPGADPRRPVDVLELVEAGAAEAGPALLVLGGVLGPRRGDLLGRDLEEDHVVHDVGVARQHLGAGEPGVLLEARVQQEAAVVVGAGAVGGVGRVAARHRDRRTGLAGTQLLGLRGLGIVAAAVRPGRCLLRGRGGARRLLGRLGGAPVGLG
jgi:hypothetical protein